MKKIINFLKESWRTILICFVVLCIFVGVIVGVAFMQNSKEVTAAESYDIEDTFTLIEKKHYRLYDEYKVYDNETKVVYLFVYWRSAHVANSSVTITVLYDCNGQPMIWEGE